MRYENEPWWLSLGLTGFEGEEDSNDEDEGEEEESEEEEDDSESQEDNDEGADEDEEQEEDPNTSGLKSALRKERMARKKAERELKRLKSQSSKGTEKEPEEEEDTSALEAERSKGERLAQRLRDQAIDMVIQKYAKDFKDTDDAIRFINRADIEVDQDDDDPSEIEVDIDSVKDAVKALAKKKAYLLKTESERAKSGSKFGGKKKNTNEPTDEALRQKYSALRR